MNVLAGTPEDGKGPGAGTCSEAKPSKEQPTGTGEEGARESSAKADDENLAVERQVPLPNQSLQGSETSAAELLAAYSTVDDRALPFVPFSPLFEMVI